MTRVLLIGFDPTTVDFADPALPPGLNAEKIHAGVMHALELMRARGWTAEHCYIRSDASDMHGVAARLAAASYDCVVIGAGVRLPANRLGIFEALVNTVHRGAPRAAIAFNTRPEDSADAAARVLAGAG